MRMGLCHFKARHSNGTGNRPNTRAQAAINSMSAKIDRIAARYRTARQALVALDPDAFLPAGRLVKTFRELLPGDIRNPRGEDPGDAPPTDAEERRRANLGEGSREIPWIWMTVRYTAQDCVDADAATDEDAIEGEFLCAPH